MASTKSEEGKGEEKRFVSPNSVFVKDNVLSLMIYDDRETLNETFNECLG
jgi:hypothetical protein